MIYPFDNQTHYDDVQLNKQMLEALQAENPIIANLIVDHFEDRLKGTQSTHCCKAATEHPDKFEVATTEQQDGKKQPLNSHMIKGTIMELPNCKIKKKRQMEKKQPLSIQTENKLLLKNRQILRLDAPGNWILEAKVASYKLYTRSFLSLLMDKGWIADENTTVFVMDVAGVSKICCGMIHDVKIFSKHYKEFNVQITERIYEKFIGVPHVNNCHWALLVIQPQRKEIIYVDPLGENQMELQKVQRLWNLYARHQFKAGYWSDRCNSWTVTTAQPHAVQKDSNSCRVYYIMKFGELIMLNRPLSEFYDDNIQRCREEIAITVLKHSVNLTNMCRIYESHSDEDDKFWVRTRPVFAEMVTNYLPRDSLVLYTSRSIL